MLVFQYVFGMPHKKCVMYWIFEKLILLFFLLGKTISGCHALKPRRALSILSDQDDQGLETQLYEGSIRNLGMFNLQKRRLRSGTIMVYKYPKAVTCKREIYSLLKFRTGQEPIN